MTEPFKIPPGAKAIIVAELHENKSEIGSDYFGSEVVDTIYLAWSYTEMDNFAEMRRAAALSTNPLINKFAIKIHPTKKYPGQNKLKPLDEYRQKYSMGNGYFLANGTYFGWQIRKKQLKFFEQSDINRLIFAKTKGKFLATNTEPGKLKPKKIRYEMPFGIKVYDYSEKSFVVTGTGSFKLSQRLKSMKGKLAKQLLNSPSGWLFSKIRFEEVMDFLKTIDPNINPESPPNNIF